MNQIQRPNILNQHKIHFITYSNEKFNNAKQRLLKEAEDFGEFETITGYGPESLSHDFVKEYSNILNQQRGGGYWIWKLDIIKDILNKIPDNDFILYMDAGSKLNKQGKKRFYEYFQMFENSNYGILSMQMSGNNGPGGLCVEKHWTTKQIFKYFNISLDNQIANSGQYLANFLLFRKNKHFYQYIEEFEKCLKTDKSLITDIYNRSSQEKYFIDNRHDQSISSIIRKKIGSIVIDGDETWMQPFGSNLSLNYPVWATRSRS